MKHGRTIAFAGLAVLALAVAPVTAQGNGQGTGQGNQALIQYIRSLPIQTIDQTERADLEYMRQEEKLARDVYLVLDMVWDLRVFENIAQSEQEHMELVKLILDRYGIPDPLPSNDIGVFRDQIFHDWFVALATFGLQSPLHAYVIGALIEDLDIVDLEDAKGRTDNRDVMTVWQNLQRGSRNHLRAFGGVLVQNGYTYFPIFLTLAEYQAIVQSAHEPLPVDENGDPLR